EGTIAQGDVQSLDALDGNTLGLWTSTPTTGVQAGSAQIEFLVSTTPAKIKGVQFNFAAFGSNNGTSFVYLYNWLKGRYDYVKGVAMTAGGDGIQTVNLP